jgi:type VII secretion protein EccB
VATKKDLVEAYSFSRRRLVTAFVSGAPGGREVEPARPGRTVVGGLALAVLLAAGAAIAGVFSPRTPDDWNQPGLLISKETGAAYVITKESDDPDLRPVINSTSAKLILGSEAEPTLISQDTIDDQHIGEDIGIFGAPASLPTSSLLIDNGWTACTSTNHGVRVTVTDPPDYTPAPGKAVTVETGGQLYVIAQSAPVDEGEPGTYVYAVPDLGRADGLLGQIGSQTTQDAIEVPRRWLALFPSGGALDWSSFQLDRLGELPSENRLPDGPGADAVVGDLLEVEDGGWFLVTDSGPAPISAFAAAVYRNINLPKHLRVDPITIPSVPAKNGDNILTDVSWPQDTMDPLLGDPCAQLTAEPGNAPRVDLVGPGTATGAGASEGLDSVDVGDKDQVVAPGRGAYVLSGDWTDRSSGLPFVIDSKGKVYPLVGQGTADLLGYGDHPVPVVPDTWLDLFECGVNLSQDAALSPPSEDDRQCGE